MKELLIKFKNLEIDKSQLKTGLGKDLYNVNCTKPETINRHDLIKVIQAYIDKKISLDLIRAALQKSQSRPFGLVWDFFLKDVK